MPKLPKICIFFPRISHLSSNRRERNLAFYFQFTTPTRKLTHNTKFECFWMTKRHKFQECQDSSALWATEMPKLDPERHEFWEHHDSSSLWARETPKILPRKTQILGTPGFFGTLGHRNTKIRPRKTRILGTP